MRTLGLGGLSVTMPHKAAAYEAVDERTPVAADAGRRELRVPPGRPARGRQHRRRRASSTPCGVDQGLDAGRPALRAWSAPAGRGGPWPGRSAARARPRWSWSTGRPTRRARAAELAGAGGSGRGSRPTWPPPTSSSTPRRWAWPEARGRAPLPARPRPRCRPARSSSTSSTTPSRHPLLAAARARGAVAVNGVGMLVHQAAHAFARWTGEAPPLRRDGHRDPARAGPPRAVRRQFVTRLTTSQRCVAHPPLRVVVGLTLGARVTRRPRLMRTRWGTWRDDPLRRYSVGVARDSRHVLSPRCPAPAGDDVEDRSAPDRG